MNRLKELRKEKKQTQKEFAKETGTPLRTLQSWENGESQIKPDKAQQLADYFGVSVGYLLGYEYDEETFFKGLGRDLYNLLTHTEKLSLQADPLQEEYFLSVAWDRMLSDAGLDPTELTKKFEKDKDHEVTSQDKEIENRIEEIYLRFITDPTHLEALKSDALVAIKFIESIEHKLRHGISKPYSYSWEMTEITAKLLDLLDRIEQREKELSATPVEK